MGCSSSCQSFETFSTALEWATIAKLGISNRVKKVFNFGDRVYDLQKTNKLKKSQKNFKFRLEEESRLETIANSTLNKSGNF